MKKTIWTVALTLLILVQGCAAGHRQIKNKTITINGLKPMSERYIIKDGTVDLRIRIPKEKRKLFKEEGNGEVSCLLKDKEVIFRDAVYTKREKHYFRIQLDFNQRGLDSTETGDCLRNRLKIKIF